MLCERCRTRPREALRRRTFPVDANGTSPLAELLCEGCEAVLAPPASGEAILEKLAQLARFGFGRGQSVLVRSPKK